MYDQLIYGMSVGVMDYQRMLAANLACLDIRGWVSFVALVLVVRCTWPLNVMADLCGQSPEIFMHIRRCSKSCTFATCGNQICCRLSKSWMQA